MSEFIQNHFKKIIIAVVVLAVLSGVLFWQFGYLLRRQQVITQPVTLEMWGLWEDDGLVRPALDAYKKEHPNVTIKYTYQNSVNYRTRAQTQISSKNIPDIVMVHDSWLPMFTRNNYLSTMPSSVMTLAEYSQIFYPVATQMLTKDNQIFAIPLEVDGLAMYYNEDLINAAGVQIPKTWPEFVDVATRLTQKDDQGNIQVAGASLGTTGNIDHWPDIIGLLFMQQPGASIVNPASPKGAEVLKFYTNFVTDPRQKTWDLTMDSSTQAFYSGKVAFYFAPSWRAHELRVANPQLKFKTAPVPQLPGRASDVAWGTFWAFAVSRNSAQQSQAWDFLKFLTSAQTEKLLYQQASQSRLFGQPYSRVDLQGEIASDPIAGSFVTQAPIYKSWYLSSKTFDQGLNDEIIKYYEDAVNATLQGVPPQSALSTTQAGIKQVLDKYVNPAPVPVQVE